ncbi:MAG TPA: phosphoglycerate kinase [Vicinamibacterales bacterium]|nr:phosphoglycerate kinase [Vicinamibacterales bacterium]
MAKLCIRDLDLTGKRAFVRIDFNVPFKNGVIGDDTRIQAAVPTIRYALDHGATVILASHFGRPKGQVVPELSLRPIGEHLATLIGRPVTFATDCIGPAAAQAVQQAEADGNRVVLLENLRFHPEESANDPAFAQQLAALADLYIDDAFGVTHRAHASVAAITKFLQPAAAGMQLEEELRYLGKALESPERPFVTIVGGAKVSDKLGVVENLLHRADRVLIGGAMAYTFLKARNVPVGRSLVEKDWLEPARSIMRYADGVGIRFELPVDHVVTDRIEAGAPHETLFIGDTAIGNRMGVDIGPATVKTYGALLADAKTVVWNGPMGVFEIDDFAVGTTGIARAVANVKGTTIIGGGDSVAAVKKAGVADRITHISVGGGASLDFLGGRRLPGVEALTNK